MGRIFVKGYSQNTNCQTIEHGERSVFGFSINFDECGLNRNREVCIFHNYFKLIIK